MTVRLLKDVPRIGKKGELVKLPTVLAGRLLRSNLSVLDPPGQELPS